MDPFVSSERLQWWQIGMAITAIAILSLSVYGGSLKNNFVAWDDTSLIYNNPAAHGFSLEAVKKAFTNYDPELYIPLTFLSYQLDYTIAGLKPFVYHLHNLILHILNALFVTWLAYTFLKRFWIALAIGLLFAVHPLHTEAVMWASARKDVLSTFYFLGALLSYLYAIRRDAPLGRLTILSLVLFLFGLLAKVSILTLPVILLLIDWYQGRAWNRRMIVEKLPFFGLSIIFGVVAMFGKTDVTSASSVSDKVLMAGKSTVFYITKFFWPTHLSVMYPYTESIAAKAEFILPLALVAILAIAVWLFKKKAAMISFGIAFFLFTLAPSFINFAKAGDLYFASDRYAYIPSIGILLILGWLLSYLSERTNRREAYVQWISITAIILCVGIFSRLSYVQAQTWQNSETLFTHTLQEYPNAIASRINLAIVYRESGRMEDALEQLKAALTIRPHIETHVNFAAIFKRQGRFDLAIEEYEKAMRVDESSAQPHFGLGILYAEIGKNGEAMAEYQKALALEPRFVAVYNNIGSLLMDQGKYAEALAAFQQTVAINPFFRDGYYNIGVALEEQGRLEEAAQAFEQALSLDPKNLDALISLAGISLRLGRNSAALETIKKTLAIDPDNQAAKALVQEMIRMGIVGPKAQN